MVGDHSSCLLHGVVCNGPPTWPSDIPVADCYTSGLQLVANSGLSLLPTGGPSRHPVAHLNCESYISSRQRQAVIKVTFLNQQIEVCGQYHSWYTWQYYRPSYCHVATLWPPHTTLLLKVTWRSILINVQWYISQLVPANKCCFSLPMGLQFLRSSR